jgi:hypothetical protein
MLYFGVILKCSKHNYDFLFAPVSILKNRVIYLQLTQFIAEVA